jgi:prepilin-type N-terminal cleavage/methylation domain-containing protein
MTELTIDPARERVSRSRDARGFTLIELMVVVVVLGILAAIAIPNYVAMQDRAKEGGTKANMHTLQVTAEDYSVQHDGAYPDDIAALLPLLPGGPAILKNPFTRTSGDGISYENRVLFMGDAANVAGITSYADSMQMLYNIKGHGKSQRISIILSSGQ